MLTSLPAEIQAGDTLQFTETVPDYSSAEGWALKFDLVGPGTKITLTSAGSGNSFPFDVPASYTENYVPGTYKYTKYVTRTVGSVVEKHTVAKGLVTILENISAGLDGAEARTPFMRIRDALLELLEGRATNDYTDLEVSTPNGMQSVTLLSLKELTDAYTHYDNLVKLEERKARIDRGESAGKILYRPDPVL